MQQAVKSLTKNQARNPDNQGLENARDHIRANQRRFAEKHADSHPGHQERVQRVERVERVERPERPERVERVERTERPERPDRPDRGRGH